jgi:hypothetical protein
MQITINPTNAAQCRDYANFVLQFRTPEGKEEIKKGLHTRFPAKYPAGTADADFETFEAFEDFAFGLVGRGAADRRLGGSLPDITQPQFNAKLLALRPPTANFQFPVDADNPAGEKGTVHVRDDGAILHNEDDVPNEKDREATHEFMHHYFDDILFVARDLLDKINGALDTFSEAPTKALLRAAYEQAVRDFENFVASLQPSIIDGKGPFNWVTIAPVVTNEGYIVSVRVEVNWKNPYHSSSTVRVP